MCSSDLKNGIASGLNNGLDYLWWSTKSLVVTAGEEQTVSILFQRKAVCLEFEVSTTSGSTLSKVTQIDFTPPSTSSSTFNLSTGLISQASSLTTGTFLTTISGFEATGYMLPVKTTKQIQLHICVEIDGAISWHSTSLPRPTNNTFLAAHSYEYSLIVDKTSNYIVKSELKGIRALD